MYNERDYYRPTGFGGFSFFPPVIKNLLIINGIVFIVNNLLLANLVVAGIPAELIITRYFALIPLSGVDLMRNMITGEIIRASFYPWQLITYQFLHGGFTHILFNMLFLWMFGMEIENLWGSKKFLLYYLLCGVGGAILQLIVQLLTGAESAPTIGASGAVFGVMVAFAMIFPNRYIYVYFLIPVKAKYLIAFLVVIEFMSAGQPSLIAHVVHIGGSLVGFLFIMFDNNNQFSFKRIFSAFRKPPTFGSTDTRGFRKRIYREPDVEDAEFYEVKNKKDENLDVSQEEIDRILDKISQSGYQNLTDREKKILFEASKKT
jgi:membrane associated rhomboid family serine protease